jgi:hypothetical protein
MSPGAMKNILVPIRMHFIAPYTNAQNGMYSPLRDRTSEITQNF